MNANRTVRLAAATASAVMTLLLFSAVNAMGDPYRAQVAALAQHRCTGAPVAQIASQQSPVAAVATPD